MAGNLTNQVRNIAQVTTAVVKATFRRRSRRCARRRIWNAETPSTSGWTAQSFAAEVDRVARKSARTEKWAVQEDVKGVAAVERSHERELMAGN